MVVDLYLSEGLILFLSFLHFLKKNARKVDKFSTKLPKFDFKRLTIVEKVLNI